MTEKMKRILRDIEDLVDEAYENTSPVEGALYEEEKLVKLTDNVKMAYRYAVDVNDTFGEILYRFREYHKEEKDEEGKPQEPAVRS